MQTSEKYFLNFDVILIFLTLLFGQKKYTNMQFIIVKQKVFCISTLNKIVLKNNRRDEIKEEKNEKGEDQKMSIR